MGKWKDGKMARWQNGKTAKWKDAKMATLELASTKLVKKEIGQQVDSTSNEHHLFVFLYLFCKLLKSKFFFNNNVKQ